MGMMLRIAFRSEGHMWNAYAAKSDTMKDAIWLGSIAMRFVENNEPRKRAFMEIMKGAFADALKEITGGTVVDWSESPGPAHERTKE